MFDVRKEKLWGILWNIKWKNFKRLSHKNVPKVLKELAAVSSDTFGDEERKNKLEERNECQLNEWVFSSFYLLVEVHKNTLILDSNN